MPTKTIAIRQRLNDKGLTLPQQTAADLLAAGKNDTEIGAEIGVARETVCRWRGYNPAFIAAVNARRAAVWQGSIDRLRGMVDKALSAAEYVLESKNTSLETKLRAAVEILKLVQLPASADTIGPQDAEAVLRKAVEDERGNARRSYHDLDDSLNGLTPFEDHLAAKEAEFAALANCGPESSDPA